jgi:epoxyqueuosine reductase QueG
MLLAGLQGQMDAFLATCGGNRIEEPAALSTPPAAPGPLRLFDPPLMAVAGAGDPLWEHLKDPEVVGPDHRSPREWLAGARSVICFFLPYSAQVRTANRIPGETASEWLYGRWEGGRLVEDLDRFLVASLQAAGWEAVAPSVDPRFAITAMRANWSERHAAFVAGLGTFSLSRSLITRAGSAGRLGSVVTDALLQPTPRDYREPAGYCQDCGACIDRCPPRAIGPEGKDNRLCSTYLDESLARFAPRYGCGKCQTGVPCERAIP